MRKQHYLAIDGRTKRHAGYKISLKVRKAHQRGFWLDKDRGRSGQDQAQGSGQAGWASADLLCDLQPGAHGLLRRLVGCASCVSQGVGAPKLGQRAYEKPKKRPNRPRTAVCADAKLATAHTRWLGWPFFQRPVSHAWVPILWTTAPSKSQKTTFKESSFSMALRRANLWRTNVGTGRSKAPQRGETSHAAVSS